MFAVINSTILIILLSINPLFAQTKSDSTVKTSDTIEVFIFVDKKAYFKGGEEALYSFISANIQYPKKALINKINGKVVVQFTVNKDGSLSDISTLGKHIGYGLEEEAIRVIKTMPNWEPALQKGKNVIMRFRMPIKFILPDEEIRRSPIPRKKIFSNPKSYDLP